MKTILILIFILLVSIFFLGAQATHKQQLTSFDSQISNNAAVMVGQGRHIFRFDTFGDEAFWGGTLRLHEGIAKVSPKQALAVGLKVDSNALPKEIVDALKRGDVNLNDPAVTAQLLEMNAVVGVTGFFSGGNLVSIGIQCAFCHSTVDDSFSPGMGKRLDGWANRDLNVGEIVALASNLSPVADLLATDVATVKRVLQSWGPGNLMQSCFWMEKHFDQMGSLLPH